MPTTTAAGVAAQLRSGVDAHGVDLGVSPAIKAGSVPPSTAR